MQSGRDREPPVPENSPSDYAEDPMIVFALMMLPGLLLLIFVVIQFIYRGKKEIDAAGPQGNLFCTQCGQNLRSSVAPACPHCGAPRPRPSSTPPDA